MLSTSLDRSRFDALWQRLGGEDHRTFDELVQRYAETSRHYHTAEHVNECLKWFDDVRSLAADADELEAAIWFHDAVYVPGALDNERVSAIFANTSAVQAGIPEQAAARIARLVEDTDHRHKSGGADSRLLNDIDLSILGAEPARYRRYTADVRREFRRVPDVFFRRGRRRVLRGFLERDPIFETEVLRDRLERQARTNITTELDGAQSSPSMGRNL